MSNRSGVASSLLGLCDRPLIVAPMGGGPSTPELVVAAAEAGALGFIAGGYQTVDQLHAQIADVRAATTAAFGVNVFVPGKPTGNRGALDTYLAALEPDARRLNVELGPASWDDDHWDQKAELLVDAAPPAVSFTFGCPPPSLVNALQQAGSVVMVTVTNASEANQAVATGADALCLQGIEAGAHRGTFDPDDRSGLETLALVTAIATTVDVPLIVAGGIALPSQVEAAFAAGAVAVQAGTAFLRSHESGAHPLHKAALVDPQFRTTVLTKSFSGRVARGLTNDFMRRHANAPAAYPEINNATRPLRAAASKQGDTHTMSLWAGTGHRHAKEAPAAEIVDWLTATVARR